MTNQQNNRNIGLVAAVIHRTDAVKQFIKIHKNKIKIKIQFALQI